MSFGALDGPGVAAFVFGKLPAHGDFISRGLDDETIEAADAAVAEAITLAALHWDYRWDDVYVETPVWRFVAAPGVLGREWTAGVFMASVDAVGRQFPLIAGFSAPTLALVAQGDALVAALDEAETLARSALLEGLSVDALLAAFEDAARHFEPAPAADPGAAFAAAALARAQATGWAPEGLFWVAGATALEPVNVTGALSGEALAALFQPLPVAHEIPAAGTDPDIQEQDGPEPADEADEAASEDAPVADETAAPDIEAGNQAEGAADGGVCEDSPTGEAVVSSTPPAAV